MRVALRSSQRLRSRAGRGSGSLVPGRGQSVSLSGQDSVLDLARRRRCDDERGSIANPKRRLSRSLPGRLPDRLAGTEAPAKDPVRRPLVWDLSAPFSDRADDHASLSWRGKLVAAHADSAAANARLRLAVLELHRAADPEPQDDYFGRNRLRLGYGRTIRVDASSRTRAYANQPIGRRNRCGLRRPTARAEEAVSSRCRKSHRLSWAGRVNSEMGGRKERLGRCARSASPAGAERARLRSSSALFPN